VIYTDGAKYAAGDTRDCSRTDNLALLAGTLAIISTPVTGLAGNTACVSAAASIAASTPSYS
jgi:hypothetical protein